MYNVPDPGIELGSPALQADSFPAELWGKPRAERSSSNDIYSSVIRVTF